MNKIVKIDSEGVLFDDGSTLYSHHDTDCCEYHWLSFGDISLSDVDDLLFDLSGNFFNKVDGYGIELVPANGFPLRVPGYGSNNGYYSDQLILELTRNGQRTTFDITECQRWEP